MFENLQNPNFKIDRFIIFVSISIFKKRSFRLRGKHFLFRPDGGDKVPRQTATEQLFNFNVSFFFLTFKMLGVFLIFF